MFTSQQHAFCYKQKSRQQQMYHKLFIPTHRAVPHLIIPYWYVFIVYRYACALVNQSIHSYISTLTTCHVIMAYINKNISVIYYGTCSRNESTCVQQPMEVTGYTTLQNHCIQRKTSQIYATQQHSNAHNPSYTIPLVVCLLPDNNGCLKIML